MENEIFISYTQPDRNKAYAIHDLLQDNGLKSWIDKSKQGIQAGEYYGDQIVKAIRSCKLFVLVHSEYANQSDEIVKEVYNASSNKKKIYIFKLDQAGYSDRLSLHLAGLHYIDATRKDPNAALCDLLHELNIGLKGSTKSTTASSDKILLNNGLELLRSKHYKDAASTLQQYSAIAPYDPDARFYLVLAMLRGRAPQDLDGILVEKMESILLPCISAAQFGHINVLLAMIKYGYYSMNGFIDRPPDTDELLENVQLNREKAKEIQFHQYDPDNPVWQLLDEFCNR